jgi:hypothetical protein
MWIPYTRKGETMTKDYHKRRALVCRLSDEAFANLQTYKDYKQLTSDTQAIETILAWAVAIIDHNQAAEVEEITQSYADAKKRQEADADTFVRRLIEGG